MPCEESEGNIIPMSLCDPLAILNSGVLWLLTTFNPPITFTRGSRTLPDITDRQYGNGEFGRIRRVFICTGFYPRSLINFEVMAQIAPLRHCDDCIQDGERESYYIHPKFPLFQGLIPGIIGLCLVRWGWFNLRLERRSLQRDCGFCRLGPRGWTGHECGAQRAARGRWRRRAIAGDIE